MKAVADEVKSEPEPKLKQSVRLLLPLEGIWADCGQNDSSVVEAVSRSAVGDEDDDDKLDEATLKLYGGMYSD